MCIFVKKYVVLVVMVIGNVECNPVMTNLSTSLRDFALPEDNGNSTSVRTLQKEEFARYANSAPVRSPIRFKDTPDNDLSSSSARVLHHEHNGYGLLDYDDQNYGHGVDYHLLNAGHNLEGQHGHGVQGHHGGYGLQGHHGAHGHDIGHSLHDHHGGHGHDIGHGLHDHHHGVGHHETHVYHGDGYGHGNGYGYGHHTKHLTHALAAKTILWPIAGIALLGAAAALVSNPVLLQLGVVSGRRKRRETSEITDYDPHSFVEWLTTQPLQVIAKTKADSEKRTAQISSVKILRPVDDFRKEIILDDVPKDRKGTVVDKNDILKRHRMNRLFNVNKRLVSRKPTANPVYVHHPDLPRTESYEDKHYVAVPLLSNSLL